MGLNERICAELCVVIPTYNERDNIGLVIDALSKALDEIVWEVIFVDDDSPDGTADLVRSIAQTDGRVRCIQRIGRRGLSSACIEGVLASSAPFVAVMDADMQHDERILPQMLSAIKDQKLDVVVGSRYVDGGGTGEWSQSRASMSRFATQLSRLVMRADIADPMSGFFVIRRDTFMGSAYNLSAIGFKILLDIFASSPSPLTAQEIPYVFRARIAGESKLDSLVLWDYLMLLLDKSVGRYVPARFISFSLIGLVGILVHMSVLTFGMVVIHTKFAWAQTAATLVAMIANFFLNNMLTYRDQRLRGWNLLYGLLTFCAACGLGAAANISVASFVFYHHYHWWLAGAVGIVISATWNYAATALFTWRRSVRPRRMAAGRASAVAATGGTAAPQVAAASVPKSPD